MRGLLHIDNLKTTLNCTRSTRIVLCNMQIKFCGWSLNTPIFWYLGKQPANHCTFWKVYGVGYREYSQIGLCRDARIYNSVTSAGSGLPLFLLKSLVLVSAHGPQDHSLIMLGGMGKSNIGDSNIMVYLTPKLHPCPLLALISSLVTQNPSSLSCQKPALCKVRVVFSKPVHAVGSGVALPVPTMAFSKPSLAATMHSALQVTPCTFPYHTLSADAETIFSAQCAVWYNLKGLN